MARWFAALLNFYDKCLTKWPYTTNIITNGPLWSLGDILAQRIENANDPNKMIDWRRVGSFGTYGFFVVGPLYTWWYRWIELRWRYHRLVNNWGRYLISKICYDQFLFEPPYLLQFFFTIGTLQGNTPETIITTIKQEYKTTFLTDCAVWPAFQAINFVFVPHRFQALYVNVLSLGWIAFLSRMANKKDDNTTIL